MNNNQHENFNSPYSSTVLSPKISKSDLHFSVERSLLENDRTNYNALTNQQTSNNLANNQRFNLRNGPSNTKSSIRDQLDKLRLINDNDLGVSRDDFNSILFKKRNNLTLKDEAELNLLK